MEVPSENEHTMTVRDSWPRLRYEFDPHGHREWTDEELTAEVKHLTEHMKINHSPERMAQLALRMSLSTQEQTWRYNETHVDDEVDVDDEFDRITKPTPLSVRPRQ